MSDSISIGVATLGDRDAVLELVHSAYRGDASRRGWTTEADLLDGQRTDIEELEVLIADPSARLLLAREHDALLGSVLIRSVPPYATLGMFAVAPTRQGSGIGSRLLGAAERVAVSSFGAERMEMHVIDVRDTLIAYYERRGYRRTEHSAPFPYGNPRFGVPRVSGLRFAVLEKQLSPSAFRGP